MRCAPTVSTTEAELWKLILQELHGESWRDLLPPPVAGSAAGRARASSRPSTLRAAGPLASGAAEGAAGGAQLVALTPGAGGQAPDAAAPANPGEPLAIRRTPSSGGSSASDGTMPLSEGSWVGRTNGELFEVITGLIPEGLAEHEHERLVLRANPFRSK